VDGTLLDTWASQKSFHPNDEHPPTGSEIGRNVESEFRGQKRTKETHASTTDPDARLVRKKGKEAKLSYSAIVLMENRSGLLGDAPRIDGASRHRATDGRGKFMTTASVLAPRPNEAVSGQLPPTLTPL
jgi:hypothetical protein